MTFLRTFVLPQNIYGVSGLQITSESTFQGHGAFRFDPTQFPGGSIVFQAMLETTNVTFPAEIRLWDLTNGAAIAATVLSSTSITPELQQSAVLTAGGDLPDQAIDYEVQLRLDDSGGSPGVSDRVAFKFAALRIS